MLLKEDIRKVALEKAVELNGYIVDITVSNTNVITIYFDRDSGVHVDDCLAISRHIHDNFDRDDEDYELTVCSPGLTNPLKIKEQYLKHQGQEVVVKKRDGKKVEFDRDKLARSIMIAFRKRPLEDERIEKMITGLVRRLESSGDSEIQSSDIGELVMDTLSEIDQVAYVRFASVYRNFREARDFEKFIGGLSEDVPKK